MNDFDDKNLVKEILDPSEVVLWVGRPSRRGYMIGGLGKLFFGLFWGLIDLIVLIAAIYTDNFSLPVALFLAFHAVPFYMGLWGFVKRAFSYKNVIYAFTDKRIIIRNGFMGLDFETLDLFKMYNARVRVNPIEKRQGRGTIILTTENNRISGSRRRRAPIRLIRLHGVLNPYEVFRELQEATNNAPSKDEGTNWPYRDVGFYKGQY